MFLTQSAACFLNIARLFMMITCFPLMIICSRNVPQQHWRRSLRLWLWVIIFWNKLKAWNSEVTNECPINQERLLKISSQRSWLFWLFWLFWTCSQVFHYKYQQFSWYQYAYLFYLHQIKASYALFTKIAVVVYLLSEF